MVDMKPALGPTMDGGYPFLQFQYLQVLQLQQPKGECQEPTLLQLIPRELLDNYNESHNMTHNRLGQISEAL